MSEFRVEKDTMGEVKVPASRYFGAQTQRSIQNFPICNENAGHKMPKEVIYAMLLIKKAAAITNKQLKMANPNEVELAKITPEICDKIIDSVNIILGIFDSAKSNFIFSDYENWVSWLENPNRKMDSGDSLEMQEFALKKYNLQYIKQQRDTINAIKTANNIPNSQHIFDWFYENEFPLVAWQTGSGTQTNMNVNEVIASVANEIETGKRGGKSPVHPNDHVNLGQSSNDTFPTAMHVSATLLAYEKLIPAMIRFSNELREKEVKFADIVKIGRTHTQDATPVTLGQEFSGYKAQIKHALFNICYSLEFIESLAQGGTAVGTGINCPEGFAEKFAENLTTISGINQIHKVLLEQQVTACSSSKMSDIPNTKVFKKGLAFSGKFKSEGNKFLALSSNDDLVQFHGSLNTLAVSIMKIANDIRFLASGPRSGLGEISLPENEPGSSIMPGKVNPTQCEALTMIACQVIGNNVAVTTGGMQGHFELNVFRPMIIKNVVDSINLLSDGINSFIDNCLIGIVANKERIKQLVDQSLMLVTALNPHIGYDNAAKIAKNAHHKGLSLKESALELGLLTKDGGNGSIKEADWDGILDPRRLV
ncbi:class II fumarate hydratase [Candidatus Deianiraea vastatrix]|uniref:Fumarate hydratase class II n=1 Tax=Candidatus Deianiraea vastatrix TaxID=2163644 RepID=A0A5B8XG97_9RICK|nr:class II fumarate hydratase [Candidatus Deianiraea vastatrix]QED23906.1 Fumarate hydratase class II [Candidatus Deianiraea vastatrix]